MHIQDIKKLKTKKGRDETGLFIAEGEKSVREIPEGWKVRGYVLSQSYASAHDVSFLKNRAPYRVVRDTIFGGLSGTVTPQGIMALCEQKKYAVRDIVRPGGLYVMGENLSDPGNIGALIRTAAAAGAAGFILNRGSGDIFNPKVLRSAASAVFHLPFILDADIKDIIPILKEASVSIYAAHPRGDTYPYALDLKQGICFLIGNEARGLSEEALALSDMRVNLPMSQTESLNASVAGGILLYEAVRQRLINNH